MDRIEDVNAPKTLEFWIPDEVVLASLGFASGLLAFASLIIFGEMSDFQIREAGFHLAPGVWFAIAAMLPFRSLVTYWWPRMLLAIMVCSCSHALAFDLVRGAAIRAGPGPAGREDLLRIMTTAGAIGALISGKGVLVLLGRPWRYRILALMIAAGALGMLSIFLWLFIYPVWQAAVVAPLGALRRELRTDQTKRAHA